MIYCFYIVPIIYKHLFFIPLLDSVFLPSTLFLCSSMTNFFEKVIYTCFCFLPFSLKPASPWVYYIFSPITPLKSVIFDLYLNLGRIDHSFLETLSSNNTSFSWFFSSLTSFSFTISFAGSSFFSQLLNIRYPRFNPRSHSPFRSSPLVILSVI